MGDFCDDSQQAEAYVRQEALAAVLCRPCGRGPDMSDGTARCRACGEEIPPARLAKVPGAECCVGCQGEREGR